ncbi:hypothetical protein HDV05_006213 [Chytridiales sp. JEL 0842]|nr:hypothetical protein HDV05_006213 [Chytridiales sp. JEL 0842]
MTELTVATVKTLKVAELKAELQKLGLATAGKKEELATRLIEHIEATAAKPEPPAAPAITAASPTKQVSTPAVAPPAAPTEVKAAVAQTPTSAVVSPIDPSSAHLSEEERKKQRAERFNIQSTQPATQASKPAVPVATATPKDDFEAAKLARAQRFGLPVAAASPATAAATAAKEKPKPKPSGIPVPVGRKPLAVSAEAIEALKKRAEKFGTVQPTVQKLLLTVEEEERRKKRAERFGSPDASAAKKVKV